MYLDLKSKLDLYKKETANKPLSPKIKGPDIHELIDGTEFRNEAGTCFVVEKQYPSSHVHGSYSLGHAVNMGITLLAKMVGDNSQMFNIYDMLFFDTETTGLAGGTGTVAFLIGIGYFENDSFVLKQYFMRDYNEEAAMLTCLNEILSTKKVLVSFNGKAFDWNLLQSRFTSNRIRLKIKNPVHIDLLYSSRMIWKHKLESCRLSSLEENILGIERVDDIPGALIPEVYFRYLDDRNAADLKKVITHNEKDVLSMVSLLIKINSLLSDPFSEAKGLAELYGTANIYEKLNDNETAISCYCCCVNSKNSMVKEMALKRLIRIYKANRDYNKVIEFLEMLLKESKLPNIPIMIELAKQYEHRVKNNARAVEIVKSALDLCLKASFSRNLYYGDLKTRLERLKRKVNQQR